jgi:HNH endonuclease/AP2 domain
MVGKWSSVPGMVWIGSHAMIPCPDCGTLKRAEARQCKQCQYAATRSPVSYELVQIDGEPCRFLPLTKGVYAIVDADLYDHLMQWNWSVLVCRSKTITYYAIRHRRGNESCSRKNILMHQQITKAGVMEVDHINHNGLDNRRSNLRKCVQQQNAGNTRMRTNNTSGFKGVSWSKASKKWLVTITDHGVQKHLGLFDDPEEAAGVYDDAAIKVFGEFAWLNFPLGGV